MTRVLVKSPEEAAAVLKGALSGLPRQATLTVADAAHKSGLSLDDAERGLMHLQSELHGTLSVTDSGHLLFRFPYGLSLPMTKRPWWRRTIDKVKGAIVGVGKFVVRAWVSIVMLGYAAAFIALALAMMLSGRDDRGGSGTLLYVVFRVVADALYWMFHPFSPVARRNVWDGSLYENRSRAAGVMRTRTIRRFGQLVEVEEPIYEHQPEEKVPFYEKVNRFVFGPEKEPELSIEEQKQKLTAQIRANQGRIGILDVMRVTGLPREQADPLMARLMLDYQGDVKVDSDGAITYHFPALRMTAGDVTTKAPPPAWTQRKQAQPITGNTGGANFLVGAVNAFNLVMASVALTANMTVERLVHMIANWNAPLPVEPLPYGGVPVVLGVIPFVFSLVLFALPMLRAFMQGRKERAANVENAKLNVLHTVVKEMDSAAIKGEPAAVREGALRAAWQKATGEPPDDKELIAAVTALGGDVDMDALAEGRGLYRFRDLEAEVRALQREREDAQAHEQEVGEVVYRT